MFKKIAAAAFFLVVLNSGFSARGQSGSRPAGKLNVLFIAVDDLRPDLGCYGDPVAITPNINKLAERGVVFNRAYCQQAVCNPSRASMLTGLRPDADGVTDLKTHFRERVPDIVTLPQLFKQNGYMAVDVGKIYHDAKFAQDSLSWSLPPIYNYNAKEDQYFLPEHRKGGKSVSLEFADVPDDYYTDGKIADAAVAWLQRFKADQQPFFLALGFKKPHLPFCAPEKYWDLYQDSTFKLKDNRGRPVHAPELAFHHSEELRGYTDIADSGSLSAQKIAQLRHGYYACISFVDTQIGKVMKALEDLGLKQNTIIVFWGDNGYHLGEQELWCKSTNFELDDRVPLIMSAPGTTLKNVKTNAIVEAVDIYPTLTDLCHIRPADSLSGTSLRPLLSSREARWDKVAYSQFTRPYRALFSKFSKTAKYMGYTVRTNEWRCTAWYNLATGSIDYKELYHLRGNAIEKINVSGNNKYAAIESRLIGLLNQYREKKGAR